MKQRKILSVVSVMLFLLTATMGEVPNLMNYQGRLTDDQGVPVPDGDYLVQFRIYDDEVGIGILWEERLTVTVEDGLFNVLLGSEDTIPDTVFTGPVRYLGIQVSPGSELTPRKPIVSVGYALRALDADTADYARVVSAMSDSDWVVIDSVLHPVGSYGLSRSQSNVLHGEANITHVSLGDGCTTGTSGVNWGYCTVGGGYQNTASHNFATVGGGYLNTAGFDRATVGGGQNNTASGHYSTVGGGFNNSAMDYAATVSGGGNNVAGFYGAVGGGNADTVEGYASFAAGYRVRVRPLADFTFAFGNDFVTSTPNAVIFHNTVNPIRVGIGTPAPDATVHVVGNIKIIDGNEGVGKVLTSDADGVGSWQDAASGESWTVADSVLHTNRYWGIARGGANNVLVGDSAHTMVNLGVACTTGSGPPWLRYCTVSGGRLNAATGNVSTVGGGSGNTASGGLATVGGGSGNTASGGYSVVGGGDSNIASEYYTTVGGGIENTASEYFATVGGGYLNTASEFYATVGGGRDDTTKAIYGGVFSGGSNLAGDAPEDTAAFVGGGYDNSATSKYATVGGGWVNKATGAYATVGGGSNCDSDGSYSFSVGNNSNVGSSYTNSAAFNGQTATASGQTRVGTLSKASGTFTIDHPMEPMQKVLNHYFVESPEMVLIYRGVAIIGSDGRAEVNLPDYFDALNRNPMVQLTGVGTSDVYVSEKVTGNRFVIGGKAGSEVYWTVTGDRKDQSAEITRRLMPVEQMKEGDLAGHSLDDDFLATTKAQLERMGEASEFEFRTSAGQEKYGQSLRALESNR